MEYDSRFETRKRNIANYQSNANYDVGNKIMYHKEVLKFNLCDYNDGYILVRGDITIVGHNLVIEVAFKNFLRLILSVSQKLMEQK